MAALHRSNWDSPTPYYGFEVALRFLAPTHMAKVNNAKPGGYSRYMRQPHKVGMILWNEFRFEGDTILLENGDAPDEAYQMCSVRSSPTEEWTAARWKLLTMGSLLRLELMSCRPSPATLSAGVCPEYLRSGWTY